MGLSQYSFPTQKAGTPKCPMEWKWLQSSNHPFLNTVLSTLERSKSKTALMDLSFQLGEIKHTEEWPKNIITAIEILSNRRSWFFKF